MSRDVLTVGSTMRIPLLYRGEYSQWVERFMNYLEEQTDEEAMINSIKNGDQPLPRVTQVSIAGTSSKEQPHLKDKSMWSDQEKKIQKIDRLARSFLIQGLPNDIYSLIDRNKTAKDLWDALARHMLGSKYGEQDRKAAWKQYATIMRQNNNLIDINIDALYNILKQNHGDVNDAMGLKKKNVVITSDPLALIAEKIKVNKSKEKVVVSSDSEGSGADDFSDLKKITALLSDDKKVEKKDDEKKRDMSKVKCYNCKKEGHFAKDCKKAKVKDYNYYKTKMLLANKDSDEQVLLAEDQAWMESSSDSDQEINANMVFMAQIEKVILDSDKSSLSVEETIAEVAYYTSESEKIFRDAIESASENFIEKHIDSQKDYDKSEVDHNDFEEKEHLVNKLIQKFNHNIAKYGDVVIGSMTIKKVYYVKGLGHNLFSVGQICNKGLEVAFRKSTCFVRNEDGVDLLTGDRSSNLYTIALNEVASNSSTCLLAKASSSQSWLCHQPLSHLNFATINNLVKINLVQCLPNMKFKKDHSCSSCEQGMIHWKHHNINGKRYVLVVVYDYSQYTWAFFLHSKDEASDVIIYFIKKTQVNLQVQVQRVRTNNGTEFKNKSLAKFFDEVGITQQFSATRMPQQNGVVERRNRTLVEAARTMLIFANLPLFLWAEAIDETY
uniref:Retrovirus-related Pol polyprotein from transposon TNT 1-94 n=1 Tax=Tanacetum cinerariifolium TaxID=118510 RepID=A0A6L2MTC3_TANCI|nr:hypothetical protein [Tanacetum cinerariifolium]